MEILLKNPGNPDRPMVMTDVLIRGRLAGQCHKCVCMEAEVVRMYFKDEGKGLKPRHAGSLWKLEMARKQTLLEFSEEQSPEDTRF